jgi:hypothetical protein
MPEGETPTAGGATPTVEELQRKIIELQDRVRDLQHEAKDHRLKAKTYRSRVEELERDRPASEPSAELDQLRRENRQLKHRSVFERVARESGAKTSGKALDTLWDALRYEADGDADPADLKARIEAAKADYDFLFQPAEGETPKPADSPADDPSRAMGGKPKPETPPAKPGPGVGRGGPADGAGKVVLRKSDVQSFDPRVNPFLDPNKAARLQQAEKEGRLVYLDE